MLLPTLAWLEDNGRLDAHRHVAIVNDLEELQHINLSRSEARRLLWQLIKKMIDNLRQTIRDWASWLRSKLRKPAD